MKPPSDVNNLIAEMTARLHEHQTESVPKGRFSRMRKTAGAAITTGVGMLSGRFRGSAEEGLAAVKIADLEKLVERLGELKGVGMKMGQILGYIDATMPDETRALLSLLQTQAQPISPAVVTTIIRNELGDKASTLLDRFDPDPISVASIGQVHKSVLPDGTVVAVKVQHEGIEEAIRADFKLAGLGPIFTRLVVPSAGKSVASVIREAEERFLEECDYRLEAERQQRFADLFAGHAVIRIPAVHHELSTRRVLTTTWEDGASFDEYLASDPTPEQRNASGRALFEFYFGTLYASGLFHADPHPGNYAFRPNGEIVIFDFGCVRAFDPETVAVLIGLAGAVRSDDSQAIIRMFDRLGAAAPKKEKEFQVMRKLLRSFFNPILTDGPHLIDASAAFEAAAVMRSKMALMRLQLPGKLLFLFRIRFGLYAVLARLGAECDWRAIDMALEKKAALQL